MVPIGKGDCEKIWNGRKLRKGVFEDISYKCCFECDP
jgi:hypothetical protein